MAIDNKKLAESLKILAQNPGKIKAQQNLYKDRLAEIRRKEETGNYARNNLEREKAKALESRDRICHSLAHSMREALNYVSQNNDYSVHAIDLDNKKLQTALSMVSLMGGKMSFSDQAGLLSQFKGDPASLRVLEAAFQKEGQAWAAKTAKDMQKPVSEQAIREMSEVLSFSEYAEAQGRLDFPIERAYWTQGEFQKTADRLGLNLDDVADPFTLALDMTMDRLKEEEMTMTEEDPEAAAAARARIAAQKYKIALAKSDIAKAAETGEDPAAIFNKGMIAAENAAAAQSAAQGAEANAE